jgi:amino acid transporter
MTTSDDSGKTRMGLHAVWAMAVGGMVGGGIFSAIGVVAEVAGAWAWLSFLLAGIIAFCTGHSYIGLAARFEEGGGAFEYLRRVKRKTLAGNLSWLLIIGYILTMAVYAFTFGHYVGEVAGLSPWLVRGLAVAVIAVLAGVNLLGVGQSSWLEIITVWGKLIVLVALAVFGLWLWQPDNLSRGDVTGGIGSHLFGACMGAGAIFMAYEGFQLLSYDYEDIRKPQRTLRIGVYAAILSVVVIYITVTLGAQSLVGSDMLIEKREVALASAGEAALGLAGKIAVSVAAAFSTASAINATLFSTARLARTVAKDNELPRFFHHTNANQVPDRALLVLAACSMVLAVIGSLERLVEAASLMFLFTFGTVNLVAIFEVKKLRWLSVVGLIGAALATAAVVYRLATHDPWVLLAILGATAALVAVRHIVIKARD